jgi:hypothetical protein
MDGVRVTIVVSESNGYGVRMRVMLLESNSHRVRE